MYKTAQFLKDLMLIWLTEKESEENMPVQVHFTIEITIEKAFEMGLITKYQAKLGKDFNNELLEVFSEPFEEDGEPPFEEDE